MIAQWSSLRPTLFTLAIMTSLSCLSTTTSIAGEAEFQECRSKLVKAQQIDLLYDMRWDKGKLPYVVVGSTFFTIPFDAKEGFAETLNCFLNAGESGRCINFDMLDYRTNKAIATFKNCKLKVY